MKEANGLPSVGPITAAIVAGVVSGAVMGSGAAWWFGKQASEEALWKYAAPMAVVQYSKIGQVVRPDEGPEAVEEVMLTVRNDIEKLKKAGFIVLDSTAVLAVPEHLTVPIRRNAPTE